MCLFSSLDVDSWAWGYATLTYTTFGVTTLLETRQLAGYLSLLHVSLKLLFLVDLLFNC